MDTRTGEIKRFDEIAEKDLRHFVPLTGKQYQAAQGMNRKQRRAVARKIRREQKRSARQEA
jgi:hypothetical protein